MEKPKFSKHYKPNDRMQDKSKGKPDLYKGLGVSKKERDDAVAVDHVIDTNKRTKFGQEPKFTD